MKYFVLFSLVAFLFLLNSCEKKALDKNLVDSSIDESSIPDSLAVYEVINGERQRSKMYRLLTETERQVLVDKGLLPSDNEVTLRLSDPCVWKDTGVGIECDPGTVRCGTISAPVSRVCLACFDADDNLLNAGACRDDL